MKSRYRNLRPETLPRRRSTAESIARSRLTVIINMGIEIVAALIMAVGLFYLVQYMYHFRHRMVETHYNAFMWAIGIFAVGWGSYIALKLRKHFRLYKELKTASNPPPTAPAETVQTESRPDRDTPD